MRLFTLVASALLALPSPAETIVIRNVNVVTMTSPKVLEKQTVVVKDGVIQSVSATAAIPKGARTIDGGGKYLMPGLADMHAHLPAIDAKGDLLNDTLMMFLANGVTTVRGMFGLPGHLELREKAKSGELGTPSPNLYVAGPPFNMQTVHSIDDVVNEVKSEKTRGWDLVKVHSPLPRDQYDALAKTARAQGIRFGGHVPAEVGIMHALEMGQETVEHLDGYVEYVDGVKGPSNPAKLAEVVKKSKDAGVWVVPTNALWEVIFGTIPVETLRAYPELKYAPAAAVDVWATSYDERLHRVPRDQASNLMNSRRQILRALNEAGVKILAGTDAPQQFSVPGFSLHRELRTLSALGLSPYEVLKTATVNPGEYFAKQASFGTITPGKRADLVLVDANPLVDVANASKVNAVMVRGIWYSRSYLDEMLKRIEVKYKA